MLRDKLVPWLQSEGASHLAYGHGSLAQHMLPPEVRCRREPARLSRPRQGESFTYWKWWPQQGLCKMRCAQLVCVVAGELNYRIGDQLLALPERAFLLVSPGTVCSDGYQPHFGRLQNRVAPLRLFWLHFLPEVTMCHLSSGAGEEHAYGGYLFAPNPFLTACANRLNDALAETTAAARTPATQKFIGSLLLTLLLDLERDLESGKALPSWPTDEPYYQVTHGTSVVERASAYINAHLDRPLTLEQIANSAHASPRHLHRCFQNDLTLSPMQYVTQCRLEKARALLQDSSMPVGTIASIVGYSSASYFTQAFAQTFGTTPTQLRLKQNRRRRRSR